MVFEYQPIEFTETRRIELPKHPISRKAWLDKSMNKVVSLLERKVLHIKEDLEIYESTYEAPIKTEYDENNTGRVRYYKASDESAVIVLPQRGSGVNIAQIVASYLATNGISAYEIETPFHGSRLPVGVRSITEIPFDLNKLKIIFTQAVTETRSLIDLIEEKNIGIFGVSLGGVYASLVYGIDDRVVSACLALAGGNFSDMIFESNERFMLYLRKHIIKDGISKEELIEKLKEVEPSNYTNPAKSDNLLFVTASNDKSIPIKYSQQLRDAWGYPEQYLVNAGHITSIKEIKPLLSKVLLHYRRTLGPFSL